MRCASTAHGAQLELGVVVEEALAPPLGELDQRPAPVGGGRAVEVLQRGGLAAPWRPDQGQPYPDLSLLGHAHGGM
jgi:hypothetical protein